jgi:hypothetical protein
MLGVVAMQKPGILAGRFRLAVGIYTINRAEDKGNISATPNRVERGAGAVIAGAGLFCFSGMAIQRALNVQTSAA